MRLRATLTAVVVTTLALTGVMGGVASAQPRQGAPTPSAPKTPDGSKAIDNLVSCVQGSRELLVLFLIDESGSLTQTDPDNRRVDAAQSALDSLVALGSGEGSPSVEVSLAAFSNQFVSVKDWTDADPATRSQLHASLETFRKRNDGTDTDFVTALSGARESLAERSATLTSGTTQAPCKAILLFTDGGFDIAVRTPELKKRLGDTKPYAPGIQLTNEAAVRRAETAGRHELCDPGGVADRLRSDDVTLLTVALSEDISVRAQVPLAAATTGEADGYVCGTPPKQPSGAYLPASGVDVLITRFDEVATRLGGGTPVSGSATVTVCTDDVCPEGSRTFNLDASLRRVHVLALPSAAGAKVVLTGPKGSATIDGAGSVTVGTVTARTTTIAGRGFAIDFDRPDDDASWTGAWKVTVVAAKGAKPGPATVAVYTFTDLGIELTSSKPLVRGAPVEVTAKVVAPKGLKVGQLVKTASVKATVDDPVSGNTLKVDLVGPPAGPFLGSITAPAGTTANAVELTVELQANTEAGAALTARSATKLVLVRRPEGAIQFVPATLDMASLTGTGTTATDVIAIGGKKDGCVWFGPTKVADAPDGSRPVSVSVDGQKPVGEGSCIKIAAGASKTVSVGASPAGRASGTVRGTVELHERTDGAQASTTQMAFRFDLARGVDQTRRLLLALALAAGGLALPMLLLFVINNLTARFQDLDAVAGTALPVTVRGKRILRRRDGRLVPLSLGAKDFGSLSGTGSNRRFRFGGVEFWARAARNPFAATMAMAAPEGGAEKLKGGAGSRVELDPALAGSWVFLLDPDRTRAAGDEAAEGLLIGFVAEEDTAAQAARMLPDIQERLPGTARELSGLVDESAIRRRRRRSKRSGRHARTPADVSAVDGSGTDEDPGATVDTAPADEAPTGEAPTDEGLVDDAASGDAPAPETADTETDTDATAAAPLGFGGRAPSPPVAPVTPPPAPDPDSSDSGPPTGFGGSGRQP